MLQSELGIAPENQRALEDLIIETIYLVRLLLRTFAQY